MSNFKNLRVWIKAKDLSVKIYKLTQNESIAKDFSFRDQIRRSAVSIASNIAEGDESGTDKLAVRYFHIAKGSAAELYTQITIAEEIGYIPPLIKDELIKECESISSMLYKLIKARIKNP